LVDTPEEVVDVINEYYNAYLHRPNF